MTAHAAWWPLVFLLASIACTQTHEEEGGAPPQAIREDADRPGYYVYRLPPTYRFSTTQQFGSGIWEYVGQYEFPELQNGVPKEVIAADLPPVQYARPMDRALRVDHLGRSWRYLERALEGDTGMGDTGEWDAVSISKEPESPVLPTPELQAGSHEPYLASLEASWSHANCAGGWLVGEHHIYDLESRDVTTYQREIEDTTVLIYNAIDINGDGNPDGVSRCTGTLVDDDAVLTAAHCVTANDNFNAVGDPGNFRVCMWGNDAAFGQQQCRGVLAIMANVPYFVGTHNVNEDFAVIFLTSNLSAEQHGLSGVTSATWDTHVIHEVAYPGFQLGTPATCVANNEAEAMQTYQSANGTWMFPTAAFQVEQAHSNHDFYTADQIRTRFDSASGHSGAALLYCPSSNNCDTSAYIIGVHSTWDSVLSRVKSPQVHLFRDFVNDSL